MLANKNVSSQPNVSRLAILACGAATLLLLSGCEKKAEGQVAAVVDGDEVTLQEVNGELQNVGEVEGEQGQMMRNAALQSVIDRHLVAGLARKDGLDQSPEYILRRQKMEESLLAQMLLEKELRNQKAPSPAEIDQFIASNPQAFSGRTVFALDQIIFPMSKRKDIIPALESAKTMAEVATTLNRLGVNFQRGNNQADSGNMPPLLFEKIKTMGASEPLIIPAGPNLTVIQVKDSKEAPIVGETARQVAQQAYRRQAIGKALQARLETAKKGAKIEYQEGFAAPEKPSVPATGRPAAVPAG